MAAVGEQSPSVAALVTSVPDSTGGSPEAGRGVGADGEGKDAATKGTEAVGDSEEDAEDVFEVEKILDMMCEGVCGGCAAGGRGPWGRIPVERRAAGEDAAAPGAPDGRVGRVLSDVSGRSLAAFVEDGCLGKF